MDFCITVADRELHLIFDTAAWVDVEKIFGSIDRMYKNLDEDILPITTGLHLAAATATSGTCNRDQKESISFAWLVKHATPVQAEQLGHMARMAILKGMERTEKLVETTGPVDADLEEAAAKKTHGGA